MAGDHSQQKAKTIDNKVHSKAAENSYSQWWEKDVDDGQSDAVSDLSHAAMSANPLLCFVVAIFTWKRR